MTFIDELLAYNRRWAESKKQKDPEFFARSAQAQKPVVLWLGCSDARVGPDKLLGLPMGSIFVHRNIGNLFSPTDLNALAVLEYAIDELRIPNIIVCGHYRCGGVAAALSHRGVAPIDLWIDQIRLVYQRHAEELERLDEEARLMRLAELNVEAQVANICRNTIVREAWRRGQAVHVIGMIYDLRTGLLKPLGIEFDSAEAFERYASQTA
ncbi:MAG: carbonic anhydrase [Zetaproteobacteria bacterium]|nr:MAG: carbonic anhydrase [Zetaproteobacteria bacterium]